MDSANGEWHAAPFATRYSLFALARAGSAAAAVAPARPPVTRSNHDRVVISVPAGGICAIIRCGIGVGSVSAAAAAGAGLVSIGLHDDRSRIAVSAAAVSAAAGSGGSSAEAKSEAKSE